MRIDKDLRALKLLQLYRAEGVSSLEEFLEAHGLDSVVPGVCIEPHCDYTTGVEGDQTQGWCESCGGNTVVSGLILAELI